MAESRELVARYSKILVDTTFSDLTLKISSKDQNTAHRCIVCMRCEDICKTPDPNDKKKKIKSSLTVPIKGVTSPHIMQRVLEFIYTGDVQFQSMEAAQIMELNKAAKVFNLRRLSYLCEYFLQSSLTVENIYVTLAAADKLSEPSVKAFCKYFAIEHFSEIVTNNQGLHTLGIDLFQEIVTAYLTFQATKSLSKVSLGDPPPSTVLEDYERLYKTMPFSDVKFVVEGEEISAHKAIVGGASEKFKQLFNNQVSVSLTGISADAFKSVLKYLYYGYDEIDPLPCCELVGFCRKFDLLDLLSICENKIRHSIDISTVLGVLEVAYQPEMAAKQELSQELKDKTFPFVVENFDRLDLDPLRKMNLRISVDLVFYMQEHLKKRGKR